MFEGSCALLHFKTIVKECDRIVDEFTPELIETLASEMDPQVVCSVAGLCNSERVHKLIEEEKAATNQNAKTVGTCNGCHTVVGLLENKFDKMSRDEFLQGLLQVIFLTVSTSVLCIKFNRRAETLEVFLMVAVTLLSHTSMRFTTT